MKFTKATVDSLPEIYGQMRQNFVEEELRDYEDAAKVFSRGNYAVYFIDEDGERKGFMCVWELDGFAFLEHFVVYERFRCGGCGGRALELLGEKYGKIILEAEPPEEEIQRRRIAFYKRNGFALNPQYYRQPPYRKGAAGCELKLLSRPGLLCDFDGAVRQIYAEVYGKDYERFPVN